MYMRGQSQSDFPVDDPFPVGTWARHRPQQYNLKILTCNMDIRLALILCIVST